MYRVIQLAVVLFTYDQGRLLVIWHWLSHKILHIFFTTSVKNICELFFLSCSRSIYGIQCGFMTLAKKNKPQPPLTPAKEKEKKNMILI